MNSTLNDQEKRAIFAELKTELLYIIIPFILLIGVKLYIATWQEIVLAPEWSLAACLIFGQITAKVSKSIATSKAQTNGEQIGWYTTKRFLLAVISIATYFGMLAKPTLGLGYFQLLIFLMAIYFHFTDGFVTKMLMKSN